MGGEVDGIDVVVPTAGGGVEGGAVVEQEGGDGEAGLGIETGGACDHERGEAAIAAGIGEGRVALEEGFDFGGLAEGDGGEGVLAGDGPDGLDIAGDAGEAGDEKGAGGWPGGEGLGVGAMSEEPLDGAEAIGVVVWFFLNRGVEGTVAATDAVPIGDVLAEIVEAIEPGEAGGFAGDGGLIEEGGGDLPEGGEVAAAEDGDDIGWLHIATIVKRMIQVNGLCRSFEDKKRGTVKAVDRVSFSVGRGEIFGLLGPNGAGKSTTLRLISTLLRPTAGTATVNGFDIVTQASEVRKQIGFLTGDMGLYARITPRETLMFFGRLAEVPEEELVRRAGELIERLDMKEFADTRSDKLSSGMKQKTAIARTLVHDPPVLILDEPTATLDLPTARVIEATILELKKMGKCVVYSTHIMEEAEYLCDRIAVINHGQLKIAGTMDELRAATGKQRLREIFLELLELPSAA